MFIFSLAACSFLPVFSQGDSTTICYSQETADSSFDLSKRLRDRYLNINQNLKDESWLLKFGISPFAITLIDTVGKYDLQNVNFSFSFEKKLSTPLSFIIQNSNTFNKSGDSVFFNWGLDYGIRYYFLMKNRISKGISGDNCNGVYIDFFIINLNKYEYHYYNLSYGDFVNADIRYHNYSYLFNTSPGLSLSVGVQKRLNDYSYIDVRFFAQYKPKDNYKRYIPKEYKGYNFVPELKEFSAPSFLRFGIDFKIGLAWGKP
jgi:hypothetical protein